MREYLTKEDTVRFCRALGSPLRVDMLQYIYQHRGTSLIGLADAMGVSRAAITQNMRILTEADLVEIKTVNGQREARRACYPKEDRFSISLGEHFNTANTYSCEIPIGQYTAYKAQPTCGIASTAALIGTVDDPRYFDDPLRVTAGILWMGSGFVEYRFPNYLEEGQRPVELYISFEISSEAPGVAENWPSDLSFTLNGRPLCGWTSPGDFGQVPGLYTPDWWFPNWNQYGLLKLLCINAYGTYLDGLMVSPVTIQSLRLDEKSDLQFRIAAPADAPHPGGLTLFGQGFGNYNQDIRVRMIYDTTK